MKTLSQTTSPLFRPECFAAFASTTGQGCTVPKMRVTAYLHHVIMAVAVSLGRMATLSGARWLSLASSATALWASLACFVSWTWLNVRQLRACMTAHALSLFQDITNANAAGGTLGTTVKCWLLILHATVLRAKMAAHA